MRRIRILATFFAFAAWCGIGVATHAAEIFPHISTSYLQEEQDAAALQRDQSVLIFGGALTTDGLGDSINPFGTHYDGGIAGIAYDHDFWRPGAGVVVSGEVGLAGRFVDSGSAEFWGGARFRRPIVIGGLSVTPALTVGLSAITGTIPIEQQREIDHDGNATLLFYFSPEISFKLTKYPQWEIVYQLHHRSGLLGTLGNMREGANANVIGLRYSF